MAYRFIEEHQTEFGLRWLLRRMQIHPNAYYNYRKNLKATYQRQKAEILEEIRSIYHELGGVVGHRNMQIFLRRKGIYLSKTTVHKYMNQVLRLRSICRRRKPGYHHGKPHKIFENHLKQNFEVEAPNRIWCTDFTYLNLPNGGFRYNCSIIDLYDRSVVASVNSPWMDSALAIKTVQKAFRSTGANPQELILHSDQGTQFTSKKFTDFCENLGITQSMSRAGCPYDNAPMERYYNTLKSELIYQYHFETIHELDKAVSEFAYNWYNQIRPHSHNGYMTPYEKRFLFKIRHKCYKKA